MPTDLDRPHLGPWKRDRTLGGWHRESSRGGLTSARAYSIPDFLDPSPTRWVGYCWGPSRTVIKWTKENSNLAVVKLLVDGRALLMGWLLSD